MSLSWQPSILASGPPGPNAAFTGCARIDLGGGAWLDHAPGWLTGSDALFAELVATARWRQKSRHLYDKIVDEPRLTAWWRPAESTAGLPPVLLAVRDTLATRYAVELDSIGCNLYRDGRDSVAWHGDSIRKVLAEAVVAIVSLGEPRRFLLRRRGRGRSMAFELGQGDLLVMGGTCQRTWEHTVPKVAVAGPRLSVTFRHSSPITSRRTT